MEAGSAEVPVGGCRLRRRRRNKGLQRKGDGDCGVVSLKWEGVWVKHIYNKTEYILSEASLETALDRSIV